MAESDCLGNVLWGVELSQIQDRNLEAKSSGEDLYRLFAQPPEMNRREFGFPQDRLVKERPIWCCQDDYSILTQEAFCLRQEEHDVTNVFHDLR